MIITMSCAGCGKAPSEILEYAPEFTGCSLTPDEYVYQEEGTLDRRTGRFLCTDCYIKHGMPSSPSGWTATRSNLLELLGLL